MRRLGFTFLETDRIQDNGVWFDAVVYVLTRAEWEAQEG